MSTSATLQGNRMRTLEPFRERAPVLQTQPLAIHKHNTFESRKVTCEGLDLQVQRHFTFYCKSNAVIASMPVFNSKCILRTTLIRSTTLILVLR